MKKEIKKTCAVIGIGRVGLPLALVLAESGYRVLGIDINQKLITELSEGKMPFLENGAEVLLKKHINKNFVLANLQDLSKCDAVFITVGTLLNDDFEPEHEAVHQVIKDVAPLMKKGSLIILRSTVVPNTTEKIYKLINKKFPGKLSLVYAPERIAEGFAIDEIKSLPQIVGSFDRVSKNKATKIFNPFVKKIIHTDPLTAELSKLTLNTYRYAKFALANELMMISNYYGRDIYEVLKVANDDYIRGGIPSPGFAAGPCLVKDSFFIRANTPYNGIIKESYDVNDNLPEYLIAELKKRTSLKDKKIAFLGLSFKKNVDDARGSLSQKMFELLSKTNKKIAVHDPYLAKGSLEKVLDKAEIVVISVNHDEYNKLTKKKIESYCSKKYIVCDIWNVLGEGNIFWGSVLK